METKEREKTQMNKVRDKRRDITISITEILRIIREYFGYSYTNKLGNVGEIHIVSYFCASPKSNQKNICIIKESIITYEIEVFIVLAKRKHLGLNEFTAAFCKAFKEDLTLMFHKLCLRREVEGTLQNLFYKP